MTAGGVHGAAMEPSPFLISSKKLTMWLFIVADAATFGAILFGYGYLRFGSPNWTEAVHLLAEHRQRRWS